MEVRQEAQEYEARLADVFSVVRDTIRRRWLVLTAVFAAVLIIGIVLTSLIQPQYTAVAKVRLDPGRSPLAVNAQQTRAELSNEAIETERTTVASVDVARMVVKNLDLVGDPEFAGLLTQSTGTAVANTEGRETVVANALLSALSVEREKQTYVLDIAFRSPDPMKAAKLANAFAISYIEVRTGKRLATAREQNAWYQERLAELSQQANVAEAGAAEFRARAGIVQSGLGGAAGTIIDQQVVPLSSSLASAESEAAAAAANLAAARSQVARGGIDAVSEVLRSSVVTDLRRQRADVLRKKSDIEVRYGERHPESLRAQGELATIDAQIDAESRRVIGALQSNANAAQARASSLRGSLMQLSSQREGTVRAAAMADSLEREAAAKRALYDRMSQMSLDSMQAASSAIAQAEVSDAAKRPARPSYPNKPLLYALSLLVAAIAAGATITTQEVLSGGFRSVEEMEAQLGLPVLAVVPKVPKPRSPTELMLERPTSMFAEAFRIARTAILGARGERRARVIAITSSLPAEGKTTSAVAFARTLAIANARTLLIECDIRRAAVRDIVKTAPPQIGLVELLHGEISLDEAIKPGDVPNLDQILVVSPFFSAENLFGEQRMEQLLAVVRERYDHIVLDLPPLMGLADGRYLATLADTVALVVKWKSTPISAVTAALGWLRNDGGNPVGVIYTQVDPSAHSVGGLSYYSKKYSDYYQSN